MSLSLPSGFSLSLSLSLYPSISRPSSLILFLCVCHTLSDLSLSTKSAAEPRFYVMLNNFSIKTFAGLDEVLAPSAFWPGFFLGGKAPL